MRILVTIPAGPIRNTFIPPEVAEKLESMGSVVWNDSQEQYTSDELKQRMNGIDVCITGWGSPRVDANVLESADKLKIIAHTGGTVASYVSDAVYDRNIKVLSGNQIYAESVAEGALAYIFSSLRGIPYFNSVVQNGKWKTNTDVNEGLFDQSVGLVGFGMTTKHLIKLLKPFRVKIKVYSKHIDNTTLDEYGIEKASLEDIFSSCKIISLHVSSRPDTFHMIDKRLLQMIPDGSVLINTARGAVIDETAMAEELQKGRFKAVLDVFEVEPLPAESKLRNLQNVVLVPHMAGPTVDRRKYVTLGLIDDIDRFYRNGKLELEITREYAALMTV